MNKDERKVNQTLNDHHFIWAQSGKRVTTLRLAEVYMVNKIQMPLFQYLQWLEMNGFIIRKSRGINDRS